MRVAAERAAQPRAREGVAYEEGGVHDARGAPTAAEVAPDHDAAVAAARVGADQELVRAAVVPHDELGHEELRVAQVRRRADEGAVGRIGLERGEAAAAWALEGVSLARWDQAADRQAPALSELEHLRALPLGPGGERHRERAAGTAAAAKDAGRLLEQVAQLRNVLVARLALLEVTGIHLVLGLGLAAKAFLAPAAPRLLHRDCRRAKCALHLHGIGRRLLDQLLVWTAQHAASGGPTKTQARRCGGDEK